MILGTTTSPFNGKSKEYTADALISHGIEAIQIAILHEEISKLSLSFYEEMIRYFSRRGLSPVVMQYTINFLRTDGSLEPDSVKNYITAMQSALILEQPAMSICGSSADENIWKYNSLTHTEKAWDAFCYALDRILSQAQRLGVVIAIEPFVNSPVVDASSLRKILDRFDCPQLQFVVDPCNIFRPDEMKDKDLLDAKVEEYLSLTMPRAFVVHFKDAIPGKDAHCPDLPAAGKGIINYNLFARTLEKFNYTGPAMIEHLSEAEFPETIDFVKRYFSFEAKPGP